MSTIKILNEVADDISFISESINGQNITKIKGLFTTVESKNKNGRTYPKRIFEREVNKLQESIKVGAILGELEHPKRTNVDYENAVIKIDNLYIQGNEVIGEASVIPAGKGLLVEGLIKVGARIGISSRGTGSLDESKTVKDDFTLITYDIVKDPSNYNSYLNAIEESKNYIIESNGSLIEAYDQLDKDLERLPSYQREEKIQAAILKFIGSLK